MHFYTSNNQILQLILEEVFVLSFCEVKQRTCSPHGYTHRYTGLVFAVLSLCLKFAWLGWLHTTRNTTSSCLFKKHASYNQMYSSWLKELHPFLTWKGNFRWRTNPTVMPFCIEQVHVKCINQCCQPTSAHKMTVGNDGSDGGRNVQ